MEGQCAHERNAPGRRVALPELPDYPFIRYEDNVLQFPGGRTAFDTLYRKMDDVLGGGKGKVSIVHIGGSHVQAGWLSNRLRTDFCGLGDSVMTARGVVFPFRILRTNAPQDYHISFTGAWEGFRCVNPDCATELGLTGAAVRTGDGAAGLDLRLNMSDTTAWEFTRLRILGHGEGAAYPYAVHGGDTLMARLDGATQSYVIDYPEACDTACIRFHIGRGERFTLTGIVPENDRSGLVYHAAGINGADVAAWLRCRRLKDDLRMVRPDLVVFGIGINDANVPPGKFDVERFKARYRELVGLVKRANPHAALLFITNNDCVLNVGRRRGKRTNPNTVRAVEAMKEIAAETGGAVWNLYHVMGGASSSALWLGKGLMRGDRVHFTATGYQLVGDMLFSAIMADYCDGDGR